MKKTINAQLRTVTWSFDGYMVKQADGTEMADSALAPITISMDEMSQANRDYAGLHGIAARIGDKAAISKCAENNYTVTDKMRRAVIQDGVTFFANAANNDWEMRVAAGPKAAPQNEHILKLATALGLTYEQTQIKLANDAIAAMTTMGR